MSDISLKRLGDVCTFVSGGTPSRKVKEYFQGNIPWITGADLKNFRIITVRNYITKDAIANSATNLLPKESIILVTRTGVGKVAINDKPLCFSQDITGIIPNENYILPQYLARFLYSKKNFLKGFQRGATIQGITRESVSGLKIHIPPLPVQKKIATILEKADQARRKRQEALHLTDQFLQSAFLEMFGNPGKNPNNWPIKPIGEFIKERWILEIQDGNHGEIHPKSSNYVSEGVPFIFANHIKSNKLDLLTCPHLLPEQAKKLRVGFSKGNDVLLSHKASLGFTAVVPGNIESLILSPQVTYYRLNSKHIRPYFLWGYFQTDYFQKVMYSVGKQSTRNYIGITRQRELPLMVPPTHLQDRYVALIQNVNGVVEKQHQSEHELETLFQSLMQKAFRGELIFN